MVNNYLKSYLLSAKLVMVAFTLAISSSVLAQTDVIVPAGNPATTTNRKPLGCFYGFERSVTSYASSELGTLQPGNKFVTHLSWFLESTFDLSGMVNYNVKIYMKEVPSATLTSSTFDSHTAGATLVYDGLLGPSNYSVVQSWISIPLQTCFIFNNADGAHAIEVMVETNYGWAPSNDPNGYFQSGGPGTSNAILFRSSTSPHPGLIQWSNDNNPATYAL